MADVRKRKNSDATQGNSNKRHRDLLESINQPSRNQGDAAGSTNKHLSVEIRPKKTPTRVPSSPSPPEHSKHVTGKDFFVYRFLDALYSSYAAPEIGTPGPVERFTCVSYPGEDDSFYELDSGQVVPLDVVEEHGLYKVALQQLEEVEEESSSSVYTPPPCGQPPRARSPSPEPLEPVLPKAKVWPPRRQGTPYVLVPANPYLVQNRTGKDVAAAKPGRAEGQDPISDKQSRQAGKTKGKARYVLSESEEEDFTPGDERDQAFFAEESLQEEQIGNGSLDDDMLGAHSDPIEDVEEIPADAASDGSSVIIVDKETGAHTAPHNVGEDRTPEAWKATDGRPPRAFIEKVMAIENAYLGAVEDLVDTFGISKDLAHMATGLHPRKIATWEAASWKAHQLAYNADNPKTEGESEAQYKLRQRLDYGLRTKSDRMTCGGDGDKMVKEYLWSGQVAEVKNLSQNKRAEIACKAVQKLARVMVTTGEFLQSVITQEQKNNGSGGASSVVTVDKSLNGQANGKVEDLNAGNGSSSKGALRTAAGVEVEPPYVTLFKASDSRKKGRGYLGLTYHKVNGQRTTIDWIKLLPNSIKGEFRLINWTLSPHPGETEFAAEKIPAKFWQEIGKKLTADDFHPVTGGCHPTAPRFVPWTEEEKKLRKGTEKYNDIAIIVSPSGAPLLTIRQAEQPRSRSDRVEARAGPVGNEEEPHGQPESQNENQNVNRPSDKLSSTARSVPKKPLPAAPLRFEALDTNAVRREASRPDKARKEGFQTATPPLEALPHSLQPTHPPQQDDERQTTYRRPHQHSSTVISNRTTVTATSSRDLPQRGELGSTQHKKLVFSHPTARIPEVASATHAFYSGSNPNPPSNRGLSFPKPKPKPKPSAPQAGPPRAVAGSSKQGQNISQDPVIVRTSSRRPAAS